MFHVFDDILIAKPKFETEPNRDAVLQDQKVLPEVGNRPLLLSVFVQSSNLLKYLLKYLSIYLLKYILKYCLKYVLNCVSKFNSKYIIIMKFTVQA